ncbi:sigma-70 family RNA polymerase sigma factor [Treponema denticola]|mgnify:FL=1|uniref:Sigma-70 family RNA polymerase sigma factor n=1 Tax=Treponema denticola TaxID=158 RepID=A0A9Q9BFA7_TREDN|nr:sigma-70 family RNA polymerase sigma factor [Treponema denticola]UTC90056.1 sigma-70 family RNA polymerase sigma factor [Treponema denticola]UTD00591.1 sigma-70 family RNA polymerase sigma factor [Treponema denticola]UTD05420.1 sigma-70 family RNA polymerase sigma factor [Treponema denticola]
MIKFPNLLRKESPEAVQDRLLCKAVLAGNTEAFSLIASKYQKRVYSLGMSFFKNHDDSEDFVQDIMLKTFSALPKFRGESSFSTWLMRIAYNSAINSVKRKREFVSAFDDFEIKTNDLTPEERQIQNCVKNAIRRAVSGLPEKYRICIDLYFFYDMPYADIESVTGIPVNTIKSHIFRSKKILKTELEHQGIYGQEESPEYPVLFKLNLAYDM